MKESARYAKIVEWSEEDQCFVGSSPGLIYGGCHGADEKAVFDQLWRCIRPFSIEPGIRWYSMLPCIAFQSCSASIALASPVTTGRVTMAYTTWPCFPRCRE